MSVGERLHAWTIFALLCGTACGESTGAPAADAGVDARGPLFVDRPGVRRRAAKD